jgi:hypothetical protein
VLQGFARAIEKMVLTDIKATEILVVLVKKQCVLKKIPRWSCVQNGKPVRVLYSLPLFKQQNNVQ